METSSVNVLGSPEALVHEIVAGPPDDHALSFGVLRVKAETKGRIKARALQTRLRVNTRTH